MNRKKREQLLIGAGVQAFTRLGFAKTNVADVIEDAKVARGTFYLYYKSKHELFHSIIDTFFSDTKRLVTKVLQNPEASLPMMLRQLGMDLFGYVNRHREMTRLVLQEAQHAAPEFRSKLDVYQDQITRDLVRVLDRSAAKGFTEFAQPDLAARLILSLLREQAIQWAFSGSVLEEKSLTTFTQFFESLMIPFAEPQAVKDKAEKSANPQPSRSSVH